MVAPSIISSSIAGSLRRYHCYIKWILSMVVKGYDGRLPGDKLIHLGQKFLLLGGLFGGGLLVIGKAKACRPSPKF